MQSFNNWLGTKLLLEFRDIKTSERIKFVTDDLQHRVDKMFDDFEWGPYEKHLTDDMSQAVNDQMFKIQNQLFDELDGHNDKINNLLFNIENARLEFKSREEEGSSLPGSILFIMFQEIMQWKKKLTRYVDTLSTAFPKRIDALRTALEKRVQSIKPMPREIPSSSMEKYPAGSQRREMRPWASSQELLRKSSQ